MVSFKNSTRELPNALDSTVKMFMRDKLIPNPSTHNDERITAVSGRPVKLSADHSVLSKSVAVLHADGKVRMSDGIVQQ